MNLAIFDLDFTLILGDSDVAWPRFLMDNGLLERAVFEAKNDHFFEQYQQGIMEIDEYLTFQLAPLAFFSKEKLHVLHQQFMHDCIVPIIPQGARDLVKQHQDNGDEVLVITATNRFIVTPIVAQFGITELIAVELEEDKKGQFTGRYVGVPSFREGKITRLNQWLDKRSQTLKDFECVLFYSDSHNDLPLLNLVNTPVAVNPDDILRAYAKDKQWQIIDFSLNG